jgi:CheY-like chemotaxis protein
MRKNRKVLAVDDNPVNLSILEEMLEGEYQVKVATNGLDALRTAADFQPNFIILDVMMPGVDGLEVCRRLRVLPDLRDTVIIMVSAKAMPSEQAAGVRAGANEYITKPFDEVVLLEVLRQYFDAGQSHADQVESGAFPHR